VPRRERTSKALRYGTRSQRDLTVLPAHPAFIRYRNDNTRLALPAEAGKAKAYITAATMKSLIYYK